jgi:hypothetical protein
LHWVLLSTKKKPTTERCSSVVHPQARSHFDYWNQSLNMHMHISYLDRHEAGLCFYLLFYFHLLPIFWISLLSLSKRKLGGGKKCKVLDLMIQHRNEGKNTNTSTNLAFFMYQ